MLKHFRHNQATRYPVLFALLMQMAMTSLICAAAPYHASAKALMICSSFGLKSIMLDEKGQPVDQAEHENTAKTCFHCASGGCGVALLKGTDAPLLILPADTPQAPVIERPRITIKGRAPPSRAPPHFL